MAPDATLAPVVWNAVVIDSADNVAVALRDLTDTAVIADGPSVRSLPLREKIISGHKLAIRPIRAGEPVRKYGHVIGTAVTDIAEGAAVHVHNLRSNRASAETG